MAQRFYNPAPVFLDLLGLQPLAGGSLTFYAQGTTTPKDTWSDAALSVANENPVPLDSSGRANTNIWTDGAYTVVLKGADGAAIWTRDVGTDDAASQTIPSLITGKFLTNDGTNLIWGDVLQVPDPSDSANYILSTDGSNLIWIPQAAAADPDIVINTSSVQLGMSTSTDKLLIQYGSSTAPASGQKGTSVDVTFPTAYSRVLWADVVLTISAATPSGALVDSSVTNLGTSGFTAVFNVSDDDSNSAWKISSAINFNWKAEGVITVTD